MRHLLFEPAMPIEKLSPEWHGPKARTHDACRRDVRGWEETPIRLKIVEPRYPYHLDVRGQGPLDVPKEGGQVSTALFHARHPEGRVPRGVGILEVEADTVPRQLRVRTAAKGGHYRRACHGFVSRQVETITFQRI